MDKINRMLTISINIKCNELNTTGSSHETTKQNRKPSTTLMSLKCLITASEYMEAKDDFIRKGQTDNLQL